MKTHILMVSREFMKGHPREGERTWFPEKIYQATVENPEHFYSDAYKEKFTTPPIPKIHTIRQNYARWKKKIDEVNAGIACLDIRTWSGKPYRSPTLEIVRLMKEDDAPDCGVSVQRCDVIIYDVHQKGLAAMGLKDHNYLALSKIKVNQNEISNYRQFLMNDGLLDHGDNKDFVNWFGAGIHIDMALIHFTQFKY